MLRKCDLTLPKGHKVNLHPLAKNAPPDYKVFGKDGHRFYLNVCRNTIQQCNGREDGMAL